MDKLLQIKVYLMDDRYHGEGDWPPSPARLFQALVAGNAIGSRLPDMCVDALRWLETIPTSPTICAHHGRLGLPYKMFVPNNDLDTKGGNPRYVANLRVGKSVQPRYINAQLPITYKWCFTVTNTSLARANRVCEMADNLYQLGRGVDMAWAKADLIDVEQEKIAFDEQSGEVFRPGEGTGGKKIACPNQGSLDSLLLRFEEHRQRFSAIKNGRKTEAFLTNPRKAYFKQITYNPGAQWHLYDLRANTKGNPFQTWPQERVVSLVEQARDAAATRLSQALPDKTEEIERILIGRNAVQADKAQRVHLMPLPSIGHQHTNQAIRRLLLMVPSDCPLRFDDIEWAFSGLMLHDENDRNSTLTSSDDLSMLRHYGLETGDSYRLWRSVTPVALPQSAARRRIDSNHMDEEAKPGSERVREEQQAYKAVIQALRHANIHTRTDSIRVQREPFSPQGSRVEAFSTGTRFAKERLWHVEIEFVEPIEGPLTIGDGRYLGLGLMAHHERIIGTHIFNILGGLSDTANPEELARSLRRAVMARVQSQIGSSQPLASYFTGHEPDGRVLRRGNHEHLAFAADLDRNRLIIISPHLLEFREPKAEERIHMAVLDLAMRDFTQLKAGKAGFLELHQATRPDDDSDPIFGCSRYWESISKYRPTRHAKHCSPEEALLSDVRGEIKRLRLKGADAEIIKVTKGPKGGLSGHVRLRFRNVQKGPILIGRSLHFGGGMFAKVDS